MTEPSTQQKTPLRRDLIVDTINGERAASSRWASALREAGFKSMGTGLRYYIDIS